MFDSKVLQDVVDVGAGGQVVACVCTWSGAPRRGSSNTEQDRQSTVKRQHCGGGGHQEARWAWLSGLCTMLTVVATVTAAMVTATALLLKTAAGLQQITRALHTELQTVEVPLQLCSAHTDTPDEHAAAGLG